jgi:hypothetical protein
MRENEVLYSVLVVCITVLLVGLGYFNSKKEEKRIDLFVECLYSSQGLFADPVEKCRFDVPRIIQWEDELDDELEEPEDLMDGGK